MLFVRRYKQNMRKRNNILKKFLNYIIHPLEGNDGKLSGKRLLGTLLVLYGIKMAWHGVAYCMEHLPDITMLVGTLLGAGLAFWGITEWGRVQDTKNSTDITTTLAPDDTSNAMKD